MCPKFLVLFFCAAFFLSFCAWSAFDFGDRPHALDIWHDLQPIIIFRFIF